MVTLHIYLEVPDENKADFLQVYNEKYVPAIRIQDGFLKTSLLQSMENSRQYEIDIEFTSETLREKWANGPEHSEVWPLVEQLTTALSWKGFNFVE